jgi:hypothetical protein
MDHFGYTAEIIRLNLGSRKVSVKSPTNAATNASLEEEASSSNPVETEENKLWTK